MSRYPPHVLVLCFFESLSSGWPRTHDSPVSSRIPLSSLFIRDEKEHGERLSFLPLPHYLTSLVFSELQLRLDSMGAKLGLS